MVEAFSAATATCIAEFGFNNPILVDTKAGIIAGHGRLLAAQKLGLTEVPVIVLDHLSEAQKRAYIIADNQLALNAGWDEDLLRAELAALQEEDFDISVIGFEDEELARLLAAQDAIAGLTDEDAVPALPQTPTSVTGDLWNLGNHKLLVGDATLQPDVERLMAGDAADMLFIDSPYNVDYEGYTDEKLKIKGDRMKPEEFKQFPAKRRFAQLSGRGEARRLAVRLPLVFVAARVSERARSRGLRGPVPDHLGQEHFRVGIRPLQIPARTDFLLPTWPARRIPGTATNRNRRCGRKTNPRPIACIRP